MHANSLLPSELFGKIVRYEIPEFQRPYVWDQGEQWEPLWEDVRDTAEHYLEDGDEATHFMGAIVLQEVPKGARGFQTHMVVDGQQRLTTLQLLLDAVQEVLNRRGHNGPAERLSFLVSNPVVFRRSDSDMAFKVWPTINDQDAFRHAMHDELSSDEHRASRIVQAHNFFKTQVDLWLDRNYEPGEAQSKAAEALEYAVSDLLELVVIDLGTADDPHIIFETLNARGTPLLQSEMIKNRILYEARSDGDERDAAVLWGFDTDQWWRREIGRGRQRRPRIEVFLNNWLTMRRLAPTRANDEFDAFKNYADGAKQSNRSVGDIAADISKIGAIYSDLERGRKQEFDTFLRRHQVMQIGVLTPVLLWLFSSDVPQSQLSKALLALESYLVRRMARGLSTRNYGQLFIGLLRELEHNGTAEAGDSVVCHLASQQAYANVWPDDQTLEEAFLTAPLYWSLTQGRLRLILEGIEMSLRSGWSGSRDVRNDLTIEHIMPQNWRRNWTLPDDVEEPVMAEVSRDRVIHSIGNLTLVTPGLNSFLSDDPWVKKRKGLHEHENLSINRNLLDNAPDVWDENAIAERARRLCVAAIKVWPHADGIT